MKRFIISSNELKLALSKLGQAISKNSVLPALTNVYCKASTGSVMFIATDLELTIKYKCNAETSGEPFEMLINFEFLKNIVGLTKQAPLTIEMKGKKGVITGENDVYELGELDDVEAFPKLPEMPKQNSVAMSAEFIPWINRALIAVTKDETRPSMQKICLDITATKMVMVSTDAHILFTRSFAIESKVVDQLLVSPKVAKALAGFDESTIYWKKTHIGFQCGNMTIIATRAEDKYPNYQAVIPEIKPNLVLAKNDLIRALEKCCLNSSNTKQTVISFQKELGTVLFEADDLDMQRKIDVRIPGSYAGEAEKIALSASMLLSLLSQVDQYEVSLSIESSTTAVLVTTEEDPDYLGLIMPIML